MKVLGGATSTMTELRQAIRTRLPPPMICNNGVKSSAFVGKVS